MITPDEVRIEVQRNFKDIEIKRVTFESFDNPFKLKKIIVKTNTEIGVLIDFPKERLEKGSLGSNTFEYLVEIISLSIKAAIKDEQEGKLTYQVYHHKR